MLYQTPVKRAAAALAAFVFAVFLVPFTAQAAPKTMPDGTVFDARYYADSNADVKAVYGYDESLLWQHFQVFGRNEGRVCAPGSAPAKGGATSPDGFDYRYYADRYPDLKEAYGYNEALLRNHWNTYGMREGRVANASDAAKQAPAKKNDGKINLNVPLPYKISINRAANTITVYGMDNNGAYSIPHKAFICSAGKPTPGGTFRLGDKVRWSTLIGNVYGQYSSRITGPYWLHSVPYGSKNEGDLKYNAYNLLGTTQSLGCVRLTVEDCKWIYDNCPTGTLIEIYDDASNPGPLGKPGLQKIDVNSPNRGWDPTDPHPSNPWR